MTRVSLPAGPERADASFIRVSSGRPREARPAAPSWTKLRREIPREGEGHAPASTRIIGTLFPQPGLPAACFRAMRQQLRDRIRCSTLGLPVVSLSCSPSAWECPKENDFGYESWGADQGIPGNPGRAGDG